MKTFYKLLVAGLIAAATNNFVWFALTYWVYLETRSVVSTGTVTGIYLVATVLSGFWFGAGAGRGLALVFTLTGIIGLIVTLLTMRSDSYKSLSKRYLK